MFFVSLDIFILPEKEKGRKAKWVHRDDTVRNYVMYFIQP